MFRYHAIAPERIKEETVGGLDQKRCKYRSKQVTLLFRNIYTELTQPLIITQYQTHHTHTYEQSVLVWILTTKKVNGFQH
jgi:hypothetical protein